MRLLKLTLFFRPLLKVIWSGILHRSKTTKEMERKFTTRETRETIAALAIVATAALTGAGLGKPAYDHFFADASADTSADAVRH